jgi:hypothetical protein
MRAGNIPSRDEKIHMSQNGRGCTAGLFILVLAVADRAEGNDI